MPIDHLSHSAVSSLATCGEAFRLKKIARRPETPSWSQVGGNAVHSVTEALDLRDFGIPTDLPFDFETSFEVEIQRRLGQDDCPPTLEWHAAGRVSKANPNKEGFAWWSENGPLMVARYQTWRRNSPTDVWLTDEGNPAIELEFLAIVNDVPVKGFIDRIEQDRRSGELMVVDIKTGSRVPTSTKQLGLYALAVHQVLGRRVSWGAYWMARDGGLTPPENLVRWFDGRLEYEYAQSWADVQAGRFGPASPSPLCGSCGVRKFCYAQGNPEDVDYPYERKAA